MKKNELIKFGLLTASMLTLIACGTKKEIQPVDPFANLNGDLSTNGEVENKAVEPKVISVTPEVDEVKDEDNNEVIDADIDYYGKDEVKQSAPSTSNTGFPATSEPVASVPTTSELDKDGKGEPWVDRFGHQHSGNTDYNIVGGTW